MFRRAAETSTPPAYAPQNVLRQRLQHDLMSLRTERVTNGAFLFVHKKRVALKFPPSTEQICPPILRQKLSLRSGMSCSLTSSPTRSCSSLNRASSSIH